MKETNPIIPPGLNFEGASRGRSNMRMAVIVVVLLHVALFTGILFNACKQKDEAAEGIKSTAEQMAEIAGPAPTIKSESMPDPVSTPPIGSGTFNPPPIIGSNPPLATGGGFESTVVPLPIETNTAIPPTIPPPPVTGTTEHAVAKGDSFYSIGRKYGVGMNAVAKANPNIIPTRLRIGQKIIIPAATPRPMVAMPVPDAPNVHTVKRGDTLGHIALKYRTKVANLKSVNGLTSDFLKIGQKLTVPMRTSAPPAPIPTAAPALSPTTGLPISVPAPPIAVGPSSSSVVSPPPAE
jgi:LysM repeat protein|tara:strand:- start:172 stop:1053 length:882 start_codon:yes stop_codon:yes gene_type:complete